MSKKIHKNKIIGVLIAGIIIIATVIIIIQPKRVNYTYEPATDLTKIRECITTITGSPKLDIPTLSQDQTLLTDVYRFCLKTVDKENLEAVLKQLAQ